MKDPCLPLGGQGGAQGGRRGDQVAASPCRPDHGAPRRRVPRTAVTEIGDVIGRIDAVQATIAAAVEEQSATTSEMVRNVAEISAGSSQISANVSDIARGTDSNRASAGGTASTAADLAASAGRLQELTGRFTV